MTAYTIDAAKELRVSRYIDAPVEKVWDAMVNRQEEWWCPKPWRVEVVEQDRRPGGRASMTMYGPEGEVMPNEGIYLAYEEGKRYVVTDAVSLESGDFTAAGPFMIGFWEVSAEGTGTRYTARARHWTEESYEQHRTMGFEEGWAICADQLAAICEG